MNKPSLGVFLKMALDFQGDGARLAFSSGAHGRSTFNSSFHKAQTAFFRGCELDYARKILDFVTNWYLCAREIKRDLKSRFLSSAASGDFRREL